MGWLDDTKACLLLEKYRQEEIRRLDEKAQMMRTGQFDERAQQSDTIWRDHNNDMLVAVDALLAESISPPPY